MRRHKSYYEQAIKYLRMGDFFAEIHQRWVYAYQVHKLLVKFGYVFEKHRIAFFSVICDIFKLKWWTNRRSLQYFMYTNEKIHSFIRTFFILNISSNHFILLSSDVQFFYILKSFFHENIILILNEWMNHRIAFGNVNFAY